MIQKLYSEIRSKGLRGWMKRTYRRIFPVQLKCFAQLKRLFRSGPGLEIGGPSNIFSSLGIVPVYSVADRIDNCNFSGTTIWEGTVKEGDTYVFNGKKAPGRQFISEASDLQCVKDSSYRFVLSSHCIEHLANPLQGLKEWIRILEPSGLLVLVVPHKDGTFDHRRPLTSIEHLVHDLNSQTDEHDLTHLEEILKFHDLERDRAAGDFQSFQSRSLRNFETRCLHHHTFDTRLAIEMIHYVGLQILNVELFKPCNIVIIAKKIGAEQTVDNERFRGINSAPCWVSPFPSDQVAGGTLNPRKSR